MAGNQFSDLRPIDKIRSTNSVRNWAFSSLFLNALRWQFFQYQHLGGLLILPAFTTIGIDFIFLPASKLMPVSFLSI